MIVNDFLLSLSLQQANILYNLFILLAALSYIPYYIYIAKQLKQEQVVLTKKEKLLFFIVYPTLCLIAPMISFGGENKGIILRSTGSGVLSVFLYGGLIACMLRVSLKKSWNIVIPAIICSRSILAFGCTFTGCCHGIPVEWGIYSRNAGTTVFPNNQIESMLGFAIFAVSVHALRKKDAINKKPIGAATLIPFGVMRLLSDIVRENHKLIGCFSFDGFVAIAMIVLGITVVNYWKKSTGYHSSNA